MITATSTLAVQPQHLDDHEDSLAQRITLQTIRDSSTCDGAVSVLKNLKANCRALDAATAHHSVVSTPERWQLLWSS